MNALAIPTEGPIKEYNDVLILAQGLIVESKNQLEDGFQVKDLVPIFQENTDKALAAYEGRAEAMTVWGTDLEQALLLTCDFIIDTACDVMGIVPLQENAEFPETAELIAAVEGLATSVLSRLGGISALDIVPIAAENFQGIISGVDGIGKIGGEMKADTRAFLKSIVFSSIRLAFQIKAKMDEAAAKA